MAEVTSGEFVAITSPLNNGVVVLPTNLVITAAVSGFTNPVTRVTFYSGTSALGFSTSAPYSYTWNGLTPGVYTLRAVALTSTGLSVTSAPSTVHRTEQRGAGNRDW